MKYKIKIHYKTGDSFSSHDETGFVELEWKNLDMAKESLSRIKNHYEYYIKNKNNYDRPKGRLPKGVVWDEEYRELFLELVTDDNEPYMFWPFWIGYFEILQHAEIIIDKNIDKDMEYNPWK